MNQKHTNPCNPCPESVSRELAAAHRQIAALEELEARFRGIAERSFDAIVTMDAEGRVTYVSPAGERISGYTSEEMIGQLFQDHLPQKETTGDIFEEISLPEHDAKQAFEEVLEGTNVEGLEVEILRKDGSRALIEVNASPIFRGGVPIGAEGVFRDITERKRAEKELRVQDRRLASVEALQQALVTLSHYINNAMAAVLGNAELCRLGDVSAGDLIEVCQTQTRRISAVLGALNSMVKEMDLRTTDIAGLQSTMFDIEEELRRSLERT